MLCLNGVSLLFKIQVIFYLLTFDGINFFMVKLPLVGGIKQIKYQASHPVRSKASAEGSTKAGSYL